MIRLCTSQVELPAMFLNIIVIDICGRKKTALALYLLLALGSFAVMFWNTTTGVITLNFFGAIATK